MIGFLVRVNNESNADNKFIFCQLGFENDLRSEECKILIQSWRLHCDANTASDFYQFLVADTERYKRLCLSVRRMVRNPFFLTSKISRFLYENHRGSPTAWCALYA